MVAGKMMKILLSSEKGSIAVILCLLLPVFISIAGLCIDGELLLYNKAKIGSATKLAAISATAFYTVNEDGSIAINESEGYAAASQVLQDNFAGAQIDSFDVNQNKCTVEAEADVNYIFLRILGINKTTVSESYTAQRNLSP